MQEHHPTPSLEREPCSCKRSGDLGFGLLDALCPPSARQNRPSPKTHPVASLRGRPDGDVRLQSFGRSPATTTRFQSCPLRRARMRVDVDAALTSLRASGTRRWGSRRRRWPRSARLPRSRSLVICRRAAVRLTIMVACGPRRGALRPEGGPAWAVAGRPGRPWRWRAIPAPRSSAAARCGLHCHSGRAAQPSGGNTSPTEPAPAWPPWRGNA